MAPIPVRSNKPNGHVHLDGFAPPAIASLQLRFPVLGGASREELDFILKQMQSLSVNARQKIGSIPQVSDMTQLSAALTRLAVEDHQQEHSRTPQFGVNP
jgi:hypothetical protein